MCLFKLKLALCIFDLQIPYVVCMVVCITIFCVLSFLLFLMLRLLSDDSYSLRGVDNVSSLAYFHM